MTIRNILIYGYGVMGQAVSRSIVPTFYHYGIPNAIPQRLVNMGETGLDAGEGFYDWKGLDVGRSERKRQRSLKR